MRDIPTEILSSLAQRNGVKARVLLWVKAHERDAERTPVSIGFWNGIQPRVFFVDGSNKTFYGAGNVLGFDKMKQQSGLYIKKFGFRLSHLTEEVQTLLRQYDAQGAEVIVHLVFFSVETDNQIGTPVRVFKGWIDKAPITTPPKNNSGGSVKIEAVGNSRILTRVNAQRKSDKSQRLRNAADAFYQYVTVTGTVRTPWGEDMVNDPRNKPPPSSGEGWNGGGPPGNGNGSSNH